MKKHFNRKSPENIHSIHKFVTISAECLFTYTLIIIVHISFYAWSIFWINEEKQTQFLCHAHLVCPQITRTKKIHNIYTYLLMSNTYTFTPISTLYGTHKKKCLLWIHRGCLNGFAFFLLLRNILYCIMTRCLAQWRFTCKKRFARFALVVDVNWFQCSMTITTNISLKVVKRSHWNAIRVVCGALITQASYERL